jgi:hypothetical protein
MGPSSPEASRAKKQMTAIATSEVAYARIGVTAAPGMPPPMGATTRAASVPPTRESSPWKNGERERADEGQ